MSELNFPTEIIDLPSKGLLYPESNPLSSGKVELKYPTAKSEDILTNQSYIQKGIVLDKLLESLIVDPNIKIKDIIIGDKNALLIAARILGYGSNYIFDYKGTEHSINLSELDNKKFDESIINKGVNEFEFTLPKSENKITFKILTGEDESNIDKELEGLRKLNPNMVPELTTRLKHMITSVDGERDKKVIREFVDKKLFSIDSRELRSYIKKVQPDVDLKITLEDGEEATLPININFFWPEL